MALISKAWLEFQILLHSFKSYETALKLIKIYLYLFFIWIIWYFKCSKLPLGLHWEFQLKSFANLSSLVFKQGDQEQNTNLSIFATLETTIRPTIFPSKKDSKPQNPYWMHTPGWPARKPRLARPHQTSQICLIIKTILTILEQHD